MEYFGYHVFHEEYKMLTEEQALFLDFGLTKLYNDMHSMDDKEGRELKRLQSAARRKHF